MQVWGSRKGLALKSTAPFILTGKSGWNERLSQRNIPAREVYGEKTADGLRNDIKYIRVIYWSCALTLASSASWALELQASSLAQPPTLIHTNDCFAPVQTGWFVNKYCGRSIHFGICMEQLIPMGVLMMSVLVRKGKGW